MSKETFYFPHDYNARGDQKITRLMRLRGWAAYGLYWALIEMLYENGGKIVKDYEHLAYDLRADLGLIQSIVEEFDLFYAHDSTSFGSRSVDRRLQERRERSIKARESGLLGVMAKRPLSDRLATAERPLSDRLATAELERKGNKRKEKKKDLAVSPPKAELVENKQLTPVQKIVRAFKEAKGVDSNDAGWDRKFFPRFVRPAAEVLAAFDGDVERAMTFILVKGSEWAHLADWGLEAVVKAAGREYNRIGGNDGPKDGAVGANCVDGSGGHRRLASSREVASEALRAIEHTGLPNERSWDLAAGGKGVEPDGEDFA